MKLIEYDLEVNNNDRELKIFVFVVRRLRREIIIFGDSRDYVNFIFGL